MVYVLEMGMDVTEGRTMQEKVLFIFHSLSVTQLTNSLFSGCCFGDRPMPSFTPKLVGVSYYLRNVHFLLSTNQDKEIILVSESGFDHLLIVP